MRNALRLALAFAFALSASGCGVKNELVKPGDQQQQTMHKGEKDPSQPPSPIGR
jgi:hypothetical protein